MPDVMGKHVLTKDDGLARKKDGDNSLLRKRLGNAKYHWWANVTHRCYESAEVSLGMLRQEYFA